MNKNSLDNLIPFEKGKSGNPNGRPRKFTTQLKLEGYKVSEINDTLQNLLACTKAELKEIKANDDATVLEITVAQAIIKSMKSGNLSSIETILSRVFGYPKASFEQTIIEQPLFPDMDKPETDEEEF